MTGVTRKQGDERGDVRPGLEVITFTLGGCRACSELKEMLHKEEIDFKNIDIDDNFHFGVCVPRYPKGHDLTVQLTQLNQSLEEVCR